MIFKRWTLSKICISLIALIWVLSFFNLKRYKDHIIVHDVVSYYGYLPAIFIFGNIHLNFDVTHNDLFNEGFFSDKYWPETAPNGGKVIKTTMGLSMLYAPFFFLGHLTAKMLGYPPLGYSLPYNIFLLLSCFFYLMIGFYYLRKLLIKNFSEIATTLTLLSVYFGTNLYFYSTTEALMSHSYLFSLLCVFLYFTVLWHDQPTFKNTIVLGFIGGLMTVIRPTALLLMLIPMLYTIIDKETFLQKIKLIVNEKYKILLLLIVFILPILPQLFYWKYITGDWLFNSYTNERFYFNNPHIIQVLFSYRNGLLIYSPIMIFALIGFIFLKRYSPKFMISALVTFAILLYTISSWWCWWFGGSYGMRALIDLFGLLALPMAAFYQFVFTKKVIYKVSLTILFLLLIALSLFQTIQYRRGLVHYDSGTKESFWINFGKLEIQPGWWESLKVPNYDRARQGLPEY